MSLLRSCFAAICPCCCSDETTSSTISSSSSSASKSRNTSHSRKAYAPLPLSESNHSFVNENDEDEMGIETEMNTEIENEVVDRADILPNESMHQMLKVDEVSPEELIEMQALESRSNVEDELKPKRKPFTNGIKTHQNSARSYENGTNGFSHSLLSSKFTLPPPDAQLSSQTDRTHSQLRPDLSSTETNGDDIGITMNDIDVAELDFISEHAKKKKKKKKKAKKDVQPVVTDQSSVATVQNPLNGRPHIDSPPTQPQSHEQPALTGIFIESKQVHDASYSQQSPADAHPTSNTLHPDVHVDTNKKTQTTQPQSQSQSLSQSQSRTDANSSHHSHGNSTNAAHQTAQTLQHIAPSQPAASKAPSVATSHPPSSSSASSSSSSSLPAVPAANVNPLDLLHVPAGVTPKSFVDMFVDMLRAYNSHSSSETASASATSSFPFPVSYLGHVTYRHIWSLLLSAHRKISGALLIPHMKEYLQHNDNRKKERLKRKIQYRLENELPVEAVTLITFLCETLAHIEIKPAQHPPGKRATDGHIILHLKFADGGSSSQMEVPSSQSFVLASGHASDPFLVHPDNELVYATSDARKFVLRNEIEFSFNDKTGITGVRSGDLCVKKLFSLNCDLRMELKRGEMDYDSQKRWILAVNEHGKPLIVNHHYVAEKYDHWIVVTVLGQQVLLGIPTLPRMQMPNH